MALTLRYFVTITCDTCGNTKSFESQQLGADRVPPDWLQAIPISESVMREFDSTECLTNYKPPVMPWEEDNADQP